MFEALDQFPKALMIFTQPNSDHEGRALNKSIMEYVSKNNNRAVFYPTLGSKAYITALSICDLVIGNSSSGIIEAPSFKTPTINIGNRQKGRIKPRSVIDVDTNTNDIILAIQKGLKMKITNFKNPYQEEKPSKSILDIIKSSTFRKLIFKEFNDLN